MIGTRQALIVIVAGAVLVPLLGSGGPGPGADLQARRLVLDRAQAADAALAELEVAIEPGLDAARRGAALVVAGDETPGSAVRLAADHIERADPIADRAAVSLDALDGAVQAAGLDPVVPSLPAAGELVSIAAQLGGSAEAADAFAAMRARAERLVSTLDEALAALEDGSLTEAQPLIAEARADHDALAAWDVELVTLPVWLGTTDAMIGAMEEILAATERGDEAAALAAAEDFAALAEEAAPADRALRIAMGEGGMAVTAAPLGRLADYLRTVAAARAAAAAIGEVAGR
jgi:hypothetical protein